MNLRSLALVLTLSAAAVAAPTALHAQAVAGSVRGDNFKDTSQFKLPAGERAAILEFEDLECPACANAAPIVKRALDLYKIGFLRHDFLIQNHYWSKDAAITARYLQDKVSPDLGEQYRRDVFANQRMIASKDDLQGFTRKWFQQHGQQMPFVMDPSGRFTAEVQADVTLGERIGLMKTPTIIVLGPRGWTQVTDVTQLYTAIDNTLAQSKAAAPVVTSNARKPKTAQK